MLSYLKSEHLADNTLTLTALCIASGIGIFATYNWGKATDRVGRRRIYLFGTTVMVIFAFPLFLLVNTGIAIVIIIAIVIAYAVIQNSLAGAQGAWFPELFNANTRSSGASIAYQFSAVVSGFTPFVVTLLYADLGLGRRRHPLPRLRSHRPHRHPDHQGNLRPRRTRRRRTRRRIHARRRLTHAPRATRNGGPMSPTVSRHTSPPYQRMLGSGHRKGAPRTCCTYATVPRFGGFAPPRPGYQEISGPPRDSPNTPSEVNPFDHCSPATRHAATNRFAAVYQDALRLEGTK